MSNQFSVAPNMQERLRTEPTEKVLADLKSKKGITGVKTVEVISDNYATNITVEEASLRPSQLRG